MSNFSVFQPEHFINKALEMGATDAKIISPEQVFTAEWVKRKCQFGCGGYGRRLTCPPYSPTPQETRRLLDEYTTAILVHFSADQGKLKEVVVALEREAFLSGYYKAFSLGAGPCRLCEKCEPNDGVCKHPYQARPSMEACGIDVYKTARAAGYPIEVVRERDYPQNYYGLLLLE
jgi:predicted metal-binding protein